jgi:hypothetical protein
MCPFRLSGPRRRSSVHYLQRGLTLSLIARFRMFVWRRWPAGGKIDPLSTRRPDGRGSSTPVGVGGSPLVVRNLWLITTLALGLTIYLARSFFGNPFAVLLAIIVAVLLAVGFAVSCVMGRSVKAEVDAGYTTLPFNRFELPEIDPRSGRTIRAAGAARLTPVERKRALAQARVAGRLR